MIRMSVLKLQTSHLLLILTDLECSTVLMAACARLASIATDFYHHNRQHYLLLEAIFRRVLHNKL
jgi:hypothetical protein